MKVLKLQFWTVGRRLGPQVLNRKSRITRDFLHCEAEACTAAIFEAPGWKPCSTALAMTSTKLVKRQKLSLTLSRLTLRHHHSPFLCW